MSERLNPFAESWRAKNKAILDRYNKRITRKNRIGTTKSHFSNKIYNLD